jgi:hypothetical protein
MLMGPFCGVWTNEKCRAWKRKRVFSSKVAYGTPFASYKGCTFDRSLIKAVFFM